MIWKNQGKVSFEELEKFQDQYGARCVRILPNGEVETFDIVEAEAECERLREVNKILKKKKFRKITLLDLSKPDWSVKRA